ncbi:hypothetical protein FQN53_008328 [Emmonsiellopsis sp. PD_33]|nr:hypothetical protein FQN53_008328 [Emmonsiellopsis sp. PD_33]
MAAILQPVDSVPLTPNEVASGVLGSISLACWIFLLVPQLIENYKYGSADAISLPFLFVWFIGDITNLAGSLWAQLVPVIIAIAVYFCLADGILISQCIYYNAKNARARAFSSSADSDVPDPTTPLLSRRMSENLGVSRSRRNDSSAGVAAVRRPSRSRNRVEDSLSKIIEETEPRSAWAKNTMSVVGICVVGAAGWLIAWKTGVWRPTPTAVSGGREEVAVGGQVLGYISAVFYLCARTPQIFKNYREKSCEGLSLLFFIFSLMGNLTYGGGILLHSTEKSYLIKNIPWLIGSLGTMLEDAVIFMQFRIYAVREESSMEDSAVVA